MPEAWGNNNSIARLYTIQEFEISARFFRRTEPTSKIWIKLSWFYSTHHDRIIREIALFFDLYPKNRFSDTIQNLIFSV